VTALLIVSRSRPDLLEHFQRAFANVTGIEVVIDRRETAAHASVERRRWTIEETLKVHGWALARPADLELPPEAPGARRILVADDHRDSRDVIEIMLRRCGHDVVKAENGGVALAKALVWHPHLVVADIFRPDTDGIELIRALRRAPAPPRIIAISGGWRGAAGLNDFDVLEDARAIGADVTLRKPLDLLHLVAVVTELLAR
jgi:two-component system chemotaxis response regulator CheY